MKKEIWSLVILIFIFSCRSESPEHLKKKPNILFCIADDWSYPHAGVYGDDIVRTPHFDRLASQGVLFKNAYTSAPSCGPSRAAILTGQDFFRLEEGGNLWSYLPKKFPIYTSILEEHGYETGHTGKGYGPTVLSSGNWENNPAGKVYDAEVSNSPPKIRDTDYSKNFVSFMKQKDSDKPFCFWYGSSEPHRRYDYKIGERNGYAIDRIQVPEFLPDTEVTRHDVADYYYEVEWFDRHLGEIVDYLESINELDNTLIIMTSDNGMPFPRAKTTIYSYGVHMPLAIRYGAHMNEGTVIDEVVSLTDIAPTILDIVGVDIPDQMTGSSLKSIISGSKSSLDREFVVAGMERHTMARQNNWGYPMRGIYTQNFAYIYNFEPDRWPMGDPEIDTWPQGLYGDVDASPSKKLLEENPEKWPDLFHETFGKRPQEQLYALKGDLINLNNLAAEPDYLKKKEELKSLLFSYLKEHKDPRIEGRNQWDEYSYLGKSEWER